MHFTCVIIVVLFLALVAEVILLKHSNNKLLAQQSQARFLASLGNKLEAEPKEADYPDPYLEIADLRNRLKAENDHADDLNRDLLAARELLVESEKGVPKAAAKGRQTKP